MYDSRDHEQAQQGAAGIAGVGYTNDCCKTASPRQYTRREILEKRHAQLTYDLQLTKEAIDALAKPGVEETMNAIDAVRRVL